MPRETITPSINLRGLESDGGEYVALPTVEVGWQRDLADVQIGMETPVRMTGGDGSSGKHHLVDHLYADDATLQAIGQGLIAELAAAGRVITDEFATDMVEETVLTSESLGRMVLDAVTASSTMGTGWYTYLTDRRDVNRLIRLLRRARDAAFGADA